VRRDDGQRAAARERPAACRPLKLGIFGGTFDPPHVGHLLVASDAIDQLGLDRLVFIPTAIQPLKTGPRAVVAPAADRLAMTVLLAGDDPRLSADAVEIDRGGLSFTIDTLSTLAQRSPTDTLFLLLGTDAWETFPRWRDGEGVMRLATVVVLQRGEVTPQVTPRLTPRVAPPLLLGTRRVDVSSTEVRARVRAGQSIRGFVPDAVRAYIERTGLYREDRHVETTD
jgi:nicotinate-nucleotide adenylyltransferase